MRVDEINGNRWQSMKINLIKRAVCCDHQLIIDYRYYSILINRFNQLLLIYRLAIR